MSYRCGNRSVPRNDFLKLFTCKYASFLWFLTILKPFHCSRAAPREPGSPLSFQKRFLISVGFLALINTCLGLGRFLTALKHPTVASFDEKAKPGLFSLLFQAYLKIAFFIWGEKTCFNQPQSFLFNYQQRLHICLASEFIISPKGLWQAFLIPLL